MEPHPGFSLVLLHSPAFDAFVPAPQDKVVLQFVPSQWLTR